MLAGREAPRDEEQGKFVFHEYFERRRLRRPHGGEAHKERHASGVPFFVIDLAGFKASAPKCNTAFSKLRYRAMSAVFQTKVIQTDF